MSNNMSVGASIAARHTYPSAPVIPPRPVPPPERVYVRPYMCGSDMMFVPDRPGEAPKTMRANPVTAFIRWLTAP